MRTRYIKPLFPVVLGLASVSVAAGDDLEAWLESDDAAAVRSVNEGALVFLTETQTRRVLQTRNWLTVTPASLQTGWVELQQCQGSLDPVPAVEVVYRYHGLRDLQVVSTRNVEHARVAGNSVQLEDVTEGGEVCIRAEVQVLRPNGTAGYFLQSGPFHRRFLDGYYPVHLDYRIRWPAGQLRLAAVQPEAQAGFRLQVHQGELAIDTLFEGKLTIEVVFDKAREGR